MTFTEQGWHVHRSIFSRACTYFAYAIANAGVSGDTMGGGMAPDPSQAPSGRQKAGALEGTAISLSRYDDNEGDVKLAVILLTINNKKRKRKDIRNELDFN